MKMALNGEFEIILNYPVNISTRGPSLRASLGIAHQQALGSLLLAYHAGCGKGQGLHIYI